MKETFNFKNPDVGEIQDIQRKAEHIKTHRAHYETLNKLLSESGEEVDITKSPALFEAFNREKLDFETILNLHPDQAKDAMEQVKIDRSFFEEGKHWNPKSKARWGIKGHIPVCVYHSRPEKYWKNEKLVNMFFNSFPAFRISKKQL